MPKIANAASTIVEEKVTNVAEPTIGNAEYQQILQDNAELKAKLEVLISSMQKSDNIASKIESPKLAEVEVENEGFVEPSANKQIKVMSLYYGSLNLPTEEGGSAKLSFNQYGQVKSVSYSKLNDIVNTNKKFVDNGLFYVLDKNAVYFLELTELYKTILNKDAIDKICDFSANTIESMLDNITDSQKEIIIHNISMSIYGGQAVDYNKVDIISRKFGVDIKAKAEGMKSFDVKA